MHLAIAPLVQANVIWSVAGWRSPTALHEPWTGMAASGPAGPGAVGLPGGRVRAEHGDPVQPDVVVAILWIRRDRVDPEPLERAVLGAPVDDGARPHRGGRGAIRHSGHAAAGGQARERAAR